MWSPASRLPYFYPRPPRGGRRRGLCRRWRGQGFLSTPSARRATDLTEGVVHVLPYFYPRPPRGGRPGMRSVSCWKPLFLSTPSARRATCGSTMNNSLPIFLSTPSARRATKTVVDDWRQFFYFYPRPPRGGRPVCSSMDGKSGLFLSTPSARRATTRRHPVQHRNRNFYPRPPRGGRPPDGIQYNTETGDFYPRPPRGGRRFAVCPPVNKGLFLSTPSARRATKTGKTRRLTWPISIHALREEGDARLFADLLAVRISIHALREEGDPHRRGPQHRPDRRFLSTPSARRATAPPSFFGHSGGYFYPRPPRGGRRFLQLLAVNNFRFLSTPSARRATTDVLHRIL